MTLLEKIKAANDLPTKAVEVPEWGVTLTLKTMSAGEGIKYQADREGQPPARAVALLLAAALVDESGHAFASADDLLAKSPRVLGRLFDEALALNAMDDTGEADRGNSLPSPTA